MDDSKQGGGGSRKEVARSTYERHVKKQRQRAVNALEDSWARATGKPDTGALTMTPSLDRLSEARVARKMRVRRAVEEPAKPALTPTPKPTRRKKSGGWS